MRQNITTVEILMVAVEFQGTSMVWVCQQMVIFLRLVLVLMVSFTESVLRGLVTARGS
jgi:hypothetical protein